MLSGLVFFGEMTIQESFLPLQPRVEPIQVIILDYRTKKVLIPIRNKRHVLEVPGVLLETINSIFYSDSL